LSPPSRSDDAQRAAQRLGDLLGYVEQLVRLEEQVATRLAQHKLADGSYFILHQHELYGLPGIRFDFNDEDGPVWLRIERVQRTAPPEIAEDCRRWIEISSDPFRMSSLQAVLYRRVSEEDKIQLIEAGDVRPEDCTPSMKPAQDHEPPGLYYDVIERLEDRPALQEALEVYCSGPWAAWAEQEKPRHRSIAVYQRLFEIAQRMAQSGGVESIELIWGIGLARWDRPEAAIEIPMIERSVEIEIADQAGAAITIRPRATVARVELRPFEKLAEERLPIAEDTARRCLRTIETSDSEGVSPFKRESFEPILKICCTQLDPEGHYLPDQRVVPESEPIAAAKDKALSVDDRYVLFARRRSSNAILQDIERLQKVVKPDEGKPPVLEGAVKTLVMGPRDGIADSYEPLGAVIGEALTGSDVQGEPVDPEHGDLFFPKPFNDDQIQIVRRLEKSDGLVVQGPPGTGKTHTIANIISHMLATGRRVLVVSHGETALKVIRDQLPEGVRDLTISVAGADREGLKQVEKAINLMLGIVNLVDGNRQRKAIQDLETAIVAGRKRLAQIDGRIAEIAANHLSPVPGAAETPYQLAQKIIDDGSRYNWFTDRPDGVFAESGIDEAALTALALARKRAGSDLKYLTEQMPSPANLPDAATILEWHRDLIAAQSLMGSVTASEPLLRRIVTRLGLEQAEALAQGLKHHAVQLARLMKTPWVWSLVERQATNAEALERMRDAVLSFLAEAKEIAAERVIFIARPVALPLGLPPMPHRETIFNALVQGKNPFGLLALALKPYRETIGQIRIAGLPPESAEAWRHVRTYTVFHGKLVSLASRWASLRPELAVPDDAHFDEHSASALDSIIANLQAVLVDHPVASKQITDKLADALGSVDEAIAVLRHQASVAQFGQELASFVVAARLNAVKGSIEEVASQFRASSCSFAESAIKILQEVLGSSDLPAEQLERVWTGLRTKLGQLRTLDPFFRAIIDTSALLAVAGAGAWAERLLREPATPAGDPLIPEDWQAAWDWAARVRYLERIGASDDLSTLNRERLATEKQLRDNFARLVKERTFFNLAATMTGSAKAALNAFAQLVRRIGRGTGKGAVLHRRDARDAMEKCYDAVPCWIMPTWRVSEQLPSALGAFDLVILDEASQSDIRELPALLRGKKILVVGDDRQVSPSAAFMSLASIQRLRTNYLGAFPFCGQVEPGASLYDLARVMFPDKFVMLKEHFRCVEPIIRFSMQFYDEPLMPLRVPKGDERLDPPLVDIFVADGERRGKSKVNPREADVILDEIEALIADPALSMVAGDSERPRSIGVISLIGADQAAYIHKKLMDRIGEAAMVRHRIACGDSATFQGDERDIVFLSMVADRKRKQSQTAMQYEQRFNVALSRARDRMILVRSVEETDLNPKDLKAKILRHFEEPMPARSALSTALIDLCQSGFERDLFSVLLDKGYRVIPQVGSEGFSIDMVVEGNDGRRLAIECDGDLYHGPDRWTDDMRRQRILERVGWVFWRCFGSNYILDRDAVLEELFQTLDRMGIKPVGSLAAPARFTEHRVVQAAREEIQNDEVSTVGVGVEETVKAEAETTLMAGDRIIIRYLDDSKSRPECYILTEQAGDPLNGFLSLSSPLAAALFEASPGDEITLRLEGGKERVVLLMELTGDHRKAA